MFFSYDPDCGFETWDTMAEAMAAAEAAVDYYRDNAEDGWNEYVEGVCYGEIIGSTRRCDVLPAPEGSGLDYSCDYTLVSKEDTYPHNSKGE